METEVTGVEIFTQLLDGESPLKCLCGQITRTRISETVDVYTAIWAGSAGGGRVVGDSDRSPAAIANLRKRFPLAFNAK